MARRTARRGQRAAAGDAAVWQRTSATQTQRRHCSARACRGRWEGHGGLDRTTLRVCSWRARKAHVRVCKRGRQYGALQKKPEATHHRRSSVAPHRAPSPPRPAPCRALSPRTQCTSSRYTPAQSPAAQPAAPPRGGPERPPPPRAAASPSASRQQQQAPQPPSPLARSPEMEGIVTRTYLSDLGCQARCELIRVYNASSMIESPTSRRNLEAVACVP
jgi:hypothetical protein